MTKLFLSVLGDLRVALDGAPVSDFESIKARALLVYLAVQARSGHSRNSLAGLLWPDVPDDSARNNLRQTLASLRQTLRDRQAPDRPLLHITRDTVQLNPDAYCWTDVAQFGAHLTRCSAHAHRHPETCTVCAAEREQAVALYQGDFLQHFFLPDSVPFEEWALLQRERARRQMLEALEHLADYHQFRGAYDQALNVALRELEVDPWRERACQQAMCAHLARGDRGAALAQFERSRRILLEEMNADPSPETVALYESIRQNGRGQTSPQPDKRAVRLPAAPTPFLARTAELDELSCLLTNPSCRFITIVGPGGIGKTRLALAAAARHALEFEDGVFFVPLASLGSPDLVPSAISSALEIPLSGEGDPGERLVNYLEKREVLVVLDNLEHLLPAAPLLSAILTRAPRVTFLATSRERLALQSEWVFDLHGLEFPPPGYTRSAGSYAAVKLLAERARQAQRDFALGAANESSVVRICQMVQGNPLAIELAAASLRMRTCDEIAAGIDGLAALTTPLRDLPERHRSMQATFEYSWRLLTRAEQMALGDLTVFRGGFEADAASRVAGAAADLLGALVDKSLLQCDTTGRYEFHEWVRQLAAQKPEPPERDDAHSRHLQWVLALAEQAEPHLVGPSQSEWLTRFDRENDNLRAALEYALARDSAGLAARLVIQIWRYWYVRGASAEGRRWADLVLGQRERLSPFELGKMLSTAGVFARRQGDYVGARNFHEECLALRREQGDKHGIAICLSNLATLTQDQGDLDQAGTLVEECIRLLREIGDERNLAVALQNYGMNLVFQGRYEAGAAVLEENLQLRTKRGDRWGIGVALSALGDIPFYQGDYAKAETIYAEALSIMREMGDKGAAAELLTSLGRAAAGRRDEERARSLYVESLEMFLDLQESRGMVVGFIAVALLFLARAQAGKAARLFAAAGSLMDKMHMVLFPADRAEYESGVATARRALGETFFAQSQIAGRALSVRQAYSLALELEPLTTSIRLR